MRGTIAFDPTFGKFYLIRTAFFGVKVFRVFRLKRIFLGVQSVNTVRRCTTSYLLVGLVCL